MEITQIINSMTSAIVGGLMVALIKYKSDEKRIEFEKTKFLTQIKEREQNKIEQRKSMDKEYIIEKVLEIDSENSLTMNYIMESKEFNEVDIHDKYLRQAKLVRGMIVRARMSHKRTLEDLNTLYSLCNSIWGKQQNYFGFSKENPENKNNLRSKLINEFEETSKVCSSLLNTLW